MLDEDGATVLLWACGRLLVWDAICPDSLIAIRQPVQQKRLFNLGQLVMELGKTWISEEMGKGS